MQFILPKKNHFENLRTLGFQPIKILSKRQSEYVTKTYLADGLLEAANNALLWETFCPRCGWLLGLDNHGKEFCHNHCAPLPQRITYTQESYWNRYLVALTVFTILTISAIVIGIWVSSANTSAHSYSPRNQYEETELRSHLEKQYASLQGPPTYFYGMVNDHVAIRYVIKGKPEQVDTNRVRFFTTTGLLVIWDGEYIASDTPIAQYETPTPSTRPMVKTYSGPTAGGSRR